MPTFLLWHDLRNSHNCPLWMTLPINSPYPNHSVLWVYHWAFSSRSYKHPHLWVFVCESHLQVPLPFLCVYGNTHAHFLHWHVYMTVCICRAFVACCFVGRRREPDIHSLRFHWPGNYTLRDQHKVQVSWLSTQPCKYNNCCAQRTHWPLRNLRHTIRKLMTSAAVRAGNWL